MLVCIDRERRGGWLHQRWFHGRSLTQAESISPHGSAFEMDSDSWKNG
jgi:hypothetical protein